VRTARRSTAAGDDRQIEHAGSAQAAGCAGSGSRVSGEDMELGAQLIELLLVGDAEMLLLVEVTRPRSLKLMTCEKRVVRSTISIWRSAMPFFTRAAGRETTGRPGRSDTGNRGSAR